MTPDLLKANDVVSVVFGRSIGGYNRDQVDDFLDQVADSLQSYAELLGEAERKNALLEEQASQFASLKESFQEALELARQGAAAAPAAPVAVGSEEAQKLISEAKVKAQSIVSQAQDQAARLADQVRSLTARRDALLTQGRELVSRFSEVLDATQGEAQ